ncbi:sushi, nidogen and EGF-like domain-containing protein 1 [Acanthaster planci]|uniref:Sushi, nidogen and EGF-like domain-containing protein 1 n=1 Tax=Acanthaster planci TaxID=133434 RepID=A0A8B7XTL6_ACAPL|nr:sushi, nidogen and EGF-like domain-containing protein 1 [Acanthaster planci]
MFNYANVTWTTGTSSDGNESGLGGIPAQVGFDASDGVNYYEVPGSQSDDIVNIDLRSNINTTGRWLFRIDLDEIQDNESPIFQSCKSPDAVYVTGGTNESRVVWDTDVVSAVDVVDGPVAASCSLVDGDSMKVPVTSNETFPLGVTTVECEAVDAAGNNATPCQFHVIVSGILFPFLGPDVRYLPKEDEETSGEVFFAFPFFFFGRNYSSFYVNTNGVISFGDELSSFQSDPLPLMLTPLIAVFMTDVDTTDFGLVLHRQLLRSSQNEMQFCEADETIREVFPEQSSFSASMLLVVTWYRVRPWYSDSLRNTFQAVLVTNGALSFAMFNYGQIQWTRSSRRSSGVSAQVL